MQNCFVSSVHSSFATIALGELDEKTKIFHRIVPAIPRPQVQVVNRSRRGNQCVTQLDAVTPGVLSQICTRPLADLNIDGDTLHRREKYLKNPLILGPRSMPKLCNRHGRTQQHGTSTAQSVPARENAGVASPRHFDQNVRINQDGSQDAILLSRLPRRSRRMYVLALGRSSRSFQMPTNAAIAWLRLATEVP